MASPLEGDTTRENLLTEKMNDHARPHLLGLLAGLFLAAGLVLTAMVVTGAWLKIAASQNITVTGAARRGVRADLMVWRGGFTAEAATLLEAQRKLKADLDTVQQFLKGNSITNATFSPINIQEVQATVVQDERGSTQQKTAGFRLTQTVEIRSPDVAGVTALDRQSTVLVEQGVLFMPAPPQYLYTQAGEAKVEMLAEATKDARARAEQIAAQGGRALGELRSARMGVFQITPLHSFETSGEGIIDTSSLDKTITAVVAATFSLK
jgi:hypothetical protein